MSSKSAPSRRATVPVWKIAGTVLALVLVAGVFVVQRLLGAPVIVVPPDVHGSQQLEFLVIGDQGTGNGRQWRVARAMEAVAAQDRQVGFVMVLGDNFYSRGVQGTDDRQWSYKFENVYQGRYLGALPFYAVLGNHDYMGKPEAEIDYARRRLGSGRWHMPDHAYVEDYGQVDGRPLLRVVYLDSNLTGPALAAQTRFLEQALTGTPEHAPVWRAIACHHPLHNFGRYAPAPAGEGAAVAGGAGEGTGSEFAAAVLAVVRRVPVDAVLSGHDHDLQVIADGTDPVQVVSGGAGRPPYAVERTGPALRYGASENGFVKMQLDPQVMRITVIGSNGAVRAGFSLARGCTDGSAACLKDEP